MVGAATGAISHTARSPSATQKSQVRRGRRADDARRARFASAHAYPRAPVPAPGRTSPAAARSRPLINATLERDHARARSVSRAGYEMLLEKPIAPTPECLEIASAAESNGRLLQIAHVLRYAPFLSSSARSSRRAGSARSSPSIGERTSSTGTSPGGARKCVREPVTQSHSHRPKIHTRRSSRVQPCPGSWTLRVGFPSYRGRTVGEVPVDEVLSQSTETTSPSRPDVTISRSSTKKGA